MHRRTFIVVLVAAIMVLSANLWLSRENASDSPGSREINLVDYEQAPAPLNVATSRLSQLQTALDQVSEAAVNQKWSAAILAMQQLDNLWQSIKPGQVATLEAEKSIEQTMLNLWNHIWNEEEQGVLATAQRLTMLFSQLTV